MNTMNRKPNVRAAPPVSLEANKKPRLDVEEASRSISNPNQKQIHGETTLDQAGTIIVPPGFEDIDWGNEEDELELINCTQILLEQNEGNNSLNLYDPLFAIESEDMKNTVKERVTYRGETNEKLRTILSDFNIEEITTMTAQIKDLKAHNETLKNENYTFQGEISLLRRNINKLTAEKQADLLNKMQLDSRLKAAEKEAKKTDNAELESLKSKLRFANMEVESLQHRLKMKARNDSSALKTSVVENKLFSSTQVQESNKADLTIKNTKRSPTCHIQVQTSKSMDSKEVQTAVRCTIGTDNKHGSNLGYRQAESQSHFRSLRKALRHLIKLEYIVTRKQLAEDLGLTSLPGDLTLMKSSKDRPSGWRYANKNNILWTVVDHLFHQELVYAASGQEQPTTTKWTEGDVETSDKKCDWVLQTNGVHRAIKFVGERLTHILLKKPPDEDFPEHIYMLLFSLLNWIEYLLWAYNSEGEGALIPDHFRCFIPLLLRQSLDRLESDNLHLFAFLRLKCLQVLKAIIVQDLYQFSGEDSDMLFEILVDTCSQKFYRHLRFHTNIMDILNALAQIEDEEIYSYLCNEEGSRPGNCFLLELADSTLDVFKYENPLAKRLLLFQSYASLAQKLNRGVNSERADACPDGNCWLSWLSSYRWEEKDSAICLCRKRFCTVGIIMLACIWEAKGDDGEMVSEYSVGGEPCVRGYRKIIEEALFRGLLFLQSISEFTSNLSLAYGTTGFISFAKSIAHYSGLIDKFELFRTKGGEKLISRLLKVGEDEREVGQNEGFPTLASCPVPGVEIMSFDDDSWPPQMPQ